MFIVVEGIDGTGKSSLVRALSDDLGARRTREPTDGPYGQAIREAFAAGRRFPMAEERRLVEADRRLHLADVILPALAAGETVVCDRYWPATCAYQGTSPEDAISIGHANVAFARKPDLLLYLDLPPALALARIQARGERITAVETYENLRECAGRYDAIWADLDLMDGVALVRLDARRAPVDLLGDAIAAIATLEITRRADARKESRERI